VSTGFPAQRVDLSVASDAPAAGPQEAGHFIAGPGSLSIQKKDDSRPTVQGLTSVFKSLFPPMKHSLLVNHPTVLSPPLLLAGARGGGDEGGVALVRAGSVYGFYYARIADPRYRGNIA
jgi:hypothetical protein